MRSLIIAAALAVGLGACTPAEREEAGAEARQATERARSELEQAVDQVDLERAAERTKEVAGQAADAVRSAAEDVQRGAERAGSETRDEAQDAGAAADRAN